MNTLDSDRIDSGSNDAAEDEPEKQCYVCWESSETKDNPIRRDCGCKGSAGYVHIRCVIKSVETMGGLLRPWKRCPQCLHPYNDPTKSALIQTMTGDRARWKRRALSSINSTIKQLLVYITVLSIQRFGPDVLAYSFDKKIFPWVVRLWNQAIVDYSNGHFLSGSVVQLCVMSCTLIGLSYRCRWQILFFLKRLVLLNCLVIAILAILVFLKEITGLEDSILVVVVALFCLSYAAHRDRAEIRLQGWLATLAQLVIMLVGLALSRFIENFIVALYNNRNLHDDGFEFVFLEPDGSRLYRMKRHDDLTDDEFERIKSEWALELKIQSEKRLIREDYWWCCA